MPSRSTFKLEGAKELSAALKSLEPTVATKAGATGTRKGAVVIRDEWESSAPRGDQPTRRTWRNKDGSQGSADYGRLHENIKVRKQRSRKAHTIRYIVTTGSAFWGRFLEFGTEHRRAQPWAGPALDRVASRVIDTVMEELRRAIDRIARRARK